jgi:ABC-type Na+ transport system ATPase subunit NatA
MALVGRNGAGKTTTLKSIMGLLPITGGVIQLDGIDLVHVPGYRRALFGIGYMPEDRRLIGPLTVEDNIRLPAWASGLAHSAQRLAYICTHMPEVAALAKRRASALSGGQQKMVALARAHGFDSGGQIVRDLLQYSGHDLLSSHTIQWKPEALQYSIRAQAARHIASLIRRVPGKKSRSPADTPRREVEAPPRPPGAGQLSQAEG